ncbi:hypothetical protein [Candidatus Mycolicibacterium alkanivorans]|uniref:Uncharacterized protein n=1 Tax=Candidatus Mycolicibacterium alkanivorans TaxID=2954114 RepID=A0ABS9YRK9_9MYCO|nr:hypothetical protein [Candidatus Mycolicibacterium alkanivorans]MCI4673458.1 hypothetical protein [Candidatus Mycolicibacterium alkanivorans]
MSEFGVFAVAYAAYFVVFGISRSFVGELNLILGHEKLEPTGQWRSFSATTSLAAGAISAILFASCALIVPKDATWILASFAVTMPFAFLADSIRYIAFTEERNSGALTIDVVWLLGTLFASPALAALGVPSIPSALLGWGLGAALGAGVALATLPQLRPRVSGASRWIAQRRVAGAQFAGDFIAASGIGQAATALIPVVSSLAVAGGLRAGYVIVGPLNVAYSAMIVFLIPRIRRSSSPHRALPSPVPAVTAAFAAFCGLCALAVTLVPSRWGEFALGPSWYEGRPVAPLLIATYLFNAIAQVFVQVMRLRDSAGLIILLRPFASVIQAVALITGAAVGGVIGAGVGSALAALLSIWAWLYALLYSKKTFEERRTTLGN